MISWAEFKFPPLNLWNRPLQEIDYLRKRNDKMEILALALVDSTDEPLARANELLHKHIQNTDRIKELEFIFYTRSGRFPNDK